MFRVLAVRLSSTLAILLCASILVFLIMRLVPGDPVATIVGPEGADPERVELIRRELGLDRPIVVQYWQWLLSVLQGDLGTSYAYREPVTSIIGRTFPLTFQLVIAGLIVGSVLGVTLGVAAALRPNSRTDLAVRMVATWGLAIPNFWLSILLVGLFAIQWRLLPATGMPLLTDDFWEAIRHLILPALAIGSSLMASIARQSRSAMLEVLGQDYIRTLRAMGFARTSTVWRHALKNASIPIVTIVGLDLNKSIAGAVVVETVFGINGMGSRLASATFERDLPTVQGIMLTIIVLIVVTNLIVDLIYSWADPRIRSAHAPKAGGSTDA